MLRKVSAHPTSTTSKEGSLLGSSRLEQKAKPLGPFSRRRRRTDPLLQEAAARGSRAPHPQPAARAGVQGAAPAPPGNAGLPRPGNVLLQRKEHDPAPQRLQEPRAASARRGGGTAGGHPPPEPPSVWLRPARTASPRSTRTPSVSPLLRPNRTACVKATARPSFTHGLDTTAGGSASHRGTRARLHDQATSPGTRHRRPSEHTPPARVCTCKRAPSRRAGGGDPSQWQRQRQIKDEPGLREQARRGHRRA